MSNPNTGIVDVDAVNRSLAIHGEEIDGNELAAINEGSAGVKGLGDDEIAAVNRSLAIHGEEIDGNELAAI